MAEDQSSGAREPGAPVAKDAIDPELIKLARPRPKIGLVTSLGVVVLCGYFLLRLDPDRQFAGESAPRPVSAADIVAGKIDEDTLVSVEADPVPSQAIRAVKTRGDLGHRLTPARGHADKLWIVFAGDGWERPSPGRYTGRLRELSDLPFAGAARQFAREHPRPVFAPVAAVRAAFATNQVKTVTGDTVALRDTDRVAFDTLDPNASTLVVTFSPETKEHGPLMDVGAWQAELAKRGIQATPAAPSTDAKIGQSDAVLGQARFDVPLSNAALTKQLEAARLWAARVEPVTKHTDTTWGALKQRWPVPEAQVDLVGFYVSRDIPEDAYVVITTEKPEEYWHVTPISVVLLLIGLLFLWAFVRAVQRDFLPDRA